MSPRKFVGAAILAATIGVTAIASATHLFVSRQIFSVEFVRGERTADGTDAILQQAVAALRQGAHASVTGYATGGDTDADAALAQARANDVMLLLLRLGADASRVTAIGQGAAPNGIPSRADILITP